MVNKQKLICVVGTNASGKSGLGVKLAKKFGGEIISADSRQVFRGLDLGSGKLNIQADANAKAEANVKGALLAGGVKNGKPVLLFVCGNLAGGTHALFKEAGDLGVHAVDGLSGLF